MKRVGAIRAVNEPTSSTIPSSPHTFHEAGRLAGLELLEGCKYPQALSMYTEPPLCEVTIEEFEELALSRLEVLRAVEAGLIRNLKDDEMAAFLLKACTQSNLILHGNEYGARNPREVEMERRRDHLSHFILRLAFCGNPENIRWFVNHESILIRTRFEKIASGDKHLFLAKCTAGCQVASGPEKRELLPQFVQIHGHNVAYEDFLVVSFESVPDLVSRRGVFLKDGFAYVPKSEAFSIAFSRFKEQLEAQLERTAKELPALRDDRILPLLDLIRKAETGASAGPGDISKGFIEGVLTADQVDGAAAHFPLCMQHLHKNMKANAHLKYNGRQQSFQNES